MRAARGMLRWSQSDLAEASDVSVETIKRLEKMDGPLTATRVVTVAAIERAFAEAGVEFTNGEAPGLRLNRRPEPG